MYALDSEYRGFNCILKLGHLNIVISPVLYFFVIKRYTSIEANLSRLIDLGYHLIMSIFFSIS